MTNWPLFLESVGLVIVGLGFLGLVSGGILRHSQFRIVLMLALGAIGVVLFMFVMFAYGGDGEGVI